MSETLTLPQIQAVRMRISFLEFSTGIPLPGAHNSYVTSAFVKLGFKWNIKEGAEIEDENAAGEVCAYVKSKDTRKYGEGTLEICTPDPYLTTLLDGGAILTDGDRIGAAAPALGSVADRAVSIELWAKRIKDGALDTDSPYAWWVYPRAENIRSDGHEHGNSTLKPTYTMQFYENSGWGDGPSNSWPAASDRVHQWVPCSAAELPAATGTATLLAS